jgi:hypothetical protein
MSNLGMYQTMTTLAKKVGGPLNLAAIIFVSGYTVIRTGEAGVKCLAKNIKGHFNGANKIETFPLFEVTEDIDCGNGLTLKQNSKYIVIEQADDAVIIEILGDKNNPYCVSADILEKVSAFRKN